jgi:hypothetical protein
MYLFEHTINAASKPWPPPMTGSEPRNTRNINVILLLLSTFGLLDLHIIAMNIENVTCDLETILALRDYMEIQHVSFYAIISQKYTDMLDIRSEEDVGHNGHPWIRSSLDEFEAQLNWLNEFGQVVPNTYKCAALDLRRPGPPQQQSIEIWMETQGATQPQSRWRRNL